MAIRKKIAAILPLYLAGIIMLAFAVLPHHHHNEYICFSNTHCAPVEEASHQHDEPAPAHEGCVKHLFQTQVTRNLSLHDNCAEGHCHHFIVPLILSSVIFELLSLEAGNNILPGTSYREKLHSILRTTDLAGRAPPCYAIG